MTIIYTNVKIAYKKFQLTGEIMKERILQLSISPEMNGQTVRYILKNEFHMASTLISRLKGRPDGICLNHIKVYTNATVQSGDLLTINVTDIDPFNPAEPRPFFLDIKYEDDDLVIINKPAGIAVHGSDRIESPTIANAFSYHYGRNQSFHPVNRLDKGTSGLMVLAKNAYVHDRLRRLMHTEMFQREYLAITEDVINPPDGLIEKPISKRPVSGIRRVIDPNGLPSSTKYLTLKVNNDHSLVSVTPITGRTHQIRLHFSSVGYPLVGDPIYGSRSMIIDRPALHSHKVHIVHPILNSEIDITESMPADMQTLVYE